MSRPRGFNKSTTSIHTYKAGDMSLEKIEENESKIGNNYDKNIESFLDADSPKSNYSKTQKDKIKDDKKVTYKKKPVNSNWAKISDKEKEDKFLRVYEENLELKKNYKDQQQNLKELSTQLKVIEKEYAYVRKGVGPDTVNRQNMQQVEELRKENKLLREKLQAVASVGGGKSNIRPKKTGLNNTGTGQASITEEDLNKARGKMSDMIRLVEILKKQLNDSEEQNRSLQGMLNNKVQINTKDSTEKNVQLVSLKARYDDMHSHFESQKKKLDETRQQVVHLNMELQKERDKAFEQATEIRRLDLKLKSQDNYEDKLFQLQKDKNNLEIELKQLASQPFFQDFKEMANVNAQQKQIQQELYKEKSDNKQLLEKNKRLESELNRKNKDLKDKSEQCDKYEVEIADLKVSLQSNSSNEMPFKNLGELDTDNYMKALQMVKWKGEDPAWTHLEVIDRQKEGIKKDDIAHLKNEIGHLILEKGELASHLEKAKSFLSTKIEYEREMQAQYEANIESLKTQLKEAKKEAAELKKMYELKGFGGGKKEGNNQIYQKGGIDYIGDNDNMSIFSTDESSYQDYGFNQNVLDLYLSSVDFNSEDIQLLARDQIPNIEGMKTFATVDFYDHPLHNTNVISGLNNNYNFLVGYKVNVDELMYQYFSTNSIVIEVYTGNENETISLGKAMIPLSDLISTEFQKDKKSYVKKGFAPIYAFKEGGTQNLNIGNIDYCIRFKFPIYDKIVQIKKYINVGMNQIQNQDEDDEEDNAIAVGKRKLIVMVERASGLSTQSNTFVYFEFNGQDFSTNAESGSDIQWPTGKFDIEMHYDEQMRNYFKSNKIQFIVFDDSAPFDQRGGDQSDIIGTVDVPLIDLTKASIIDLNGIDILSIEETDLRKKVSKGKLYLKIMWADATGILQRPQMEDNIMNQAWEQEMTQKIAMAMKQRCLQLQNAFMIFDRDQDNIISLQDFSTTIKGALGMHKLIKEEIELYFKKLPQPFDWEKFAHIFKPYLNPMVDTSGLKNFDDIDFKDPYYMSYMKDKYPDRYGQEKELTDINKEIASHSKQISGSSRFSQEDINRYQYLINEIHTIFSKQMRLKSTKQIFEDIDKDGSGFISRLELKTYLTRNGLPRKISDDKDFTNFMEILDKNGDNQINLQEFYEYIMGSNISATSHSKQASSVSSNSTMYQQELTDKVMDGIIDYMKQNKKTFIKVHADMDKNQDNNVSKKELRDFLQNSIKLNLNIDELNTVVQHFDVNNDDKISVKEFIETMKDKTRQRQRNSANSQDYRNLFNQAPKAQTVDALVKSLARYMKSNNLKMSQIFSIIDQNKDGTLSRKEMKELFVDQIQVRISESEFNDFYSCFDTDGNDKVSVNEFVAVIAPEMEKVENTKMSKGNYSQVEIESLRTKAANAVRKYENNMFQQFQSVEETDGKPFVTKEDFVRIISTTIPKTDQLYFIQEDIHALLDYVCTINLSGLVNYRHFLGLGVIKYQELDNNESMLISQQLSNQVFSKLAKVIKKNKIDINIAFKSFDTDGDGKINAQELYQCLNLMKLDYKPDQVDMIMLYVDKNKSGSITIEEFKAAIEKNA